MQFEYYSLILLLQLLYPLFCIIFPYPLLQSSALTLPQNPSAVVFSHVRSRIPFPFLYYSLAYAPLYFRSSFFLPFL